MSDSKFDELLSEEPEAPRCDRDKPVDVLAREALAATRDGALDGMEVPADIEAVWGGGRVDGTGQPAINVARALIEAWGLDTFRGSALHQQAFAEMNRDARLEPIRRQFVKTHRPPSRTDDALPEPEDA